MKEDNSINISAEKTNEDEYILEVQKIFDKQKDLESDLKTAEKVSTVDEASKKWNTNDRITNLFANKIENDIKLKGKYAVILIIILILQLVVLNILFVLKGCNVLKFSDTTFNIFVTGGMAEIFVLVKIIVSSLFNDDLTELLKIILKANNYKFKENNDNKSNDKKN